MENETMNKGLLLRLKFLLMFLKKIFPDMGIGNT